MCLLQHLPFHYKIIKPQCHSSFLVPSYKRQHKKKEKKRYDTYPSLLSVRLKHTHFNVKLSLDEGGDE